jgi:hypothetical protein
MNEEVAEDSQVRSQLFGIDPLQYLAQHISNN